MKYHIVNVRNPNKTEPLDKLAPLRHIAYAPKLIWRESDQRPKDFGKVHFGTLLVYHL